MKKLLFLLLLLIPALAMGQYSGPPSNWPVDTSYTYPLQVWPPDTPIISHGNVSIPLDTGSLYYFKITEPDTTEAIFLISSKEYPVAHQVEGYFVHRYYSNDGDEVLNSDKKPFPRDTWYWDWWIKNEDSSWQKPYRTW